MKGIRRRKSLAILIVSLVSVMNFFIIIQNQYIPQDTNYLTNTPNNMPDLLPDPNDIPPLDSSDDSYPDTPAEIDSAESDYISDYYYRYKDFVFTNINESISFILQNLMNQSDGGFYQAVNLTSGGQNETTKYTATN